MPDASLEIAKALLEPDLTVLPSKSSIEVAEALLEPPPGAGEVDGGDSDGPESLTVISEVKKGAALIPTDVVWKNFDFYGSLCI